MQASPLAVGITVPDVSGKAIANLGYEAQSTSTLYLSTTPSTCAPSY